MGYVCGGYLNYERLPPSASDLSSDLHVGKKGVASLLEKMRGIEASLGEAESNKAKAGAFSGDVEIDEHSFRTFHISRSNPHYKHLMTKELLKTNHKYFVCHLRFIAIRTRGGKRLIAKVLPIKPVPPSSPPPALSNQELLECGVLKHVKGGSTVMYSDGAQAYDSIIQKRYPNLILKPVNHYEMEFTKKIAWFKVLCNKKSLYHAMHAVVYWWLSCSYITFYV